MANFALLQPIVSIILIFFHSGKYSTLAASQMAWCVAKPGSTDQMLQAGLDYACNHADCGPIQQGGSCFDPNTLVQHAAFAVNMYYQSMGRHKWDCDFNDSALLSLTDPRGNAEVDTELLQSNIDFACQKVDCSPIKSGGACFDPNTPMHHASFAMNLYYQNNGKTAASCDFNNSGLIVAANDPSDNTFLS
ncbi:hypothetical protein KPL71_005944 [Citrus sinensis]|uniref:Uncharacterized protein n=1 Tax=Citrus sinensis TaxID=2711 RepID=A0ACB8NHR6_CITSI|nr:hypothetical protein KPL71_005944 [Citrus sinensis]